MSNGTSQPILSVQQLSIDVGMGASSRRVVDHLSFDLFAGQTLCIAGESGSGKSLSSLACTGSGNSSSGMSSMAWSRLL